MPISQSVRCDDRAKVWKANDWNSFRIRMMGDIPTVTLWINGVQMVDYTETDDSLPQHGMIGLQVHGGGAAEIRYKEITIEELP